MCSRWEFVRTENSVNLLAGFIHIPNFYHITLLAEMGTNLASERQLLLTCRPDSAHTSNIS
jgi:hypothetical protein